MRKKYFSFVFCGLLLVISHTVLADGLDIQGQFGSRLEVNIDRKAHEEIPEFNNELTLELSHAYESSGLFKGTFKWDSTDNEVEVSELYSELYLSTTDLTIGKQRIAWGKGDGINPTDYFNPEDLSDPFEEENKINIPAVRVKKYYQDWIFDLVWSPLFEGNKLPQPGDRWYPEEDLKLGPGYSLVLKDPIKPGRRMKDSQFGLRLSRWSGSIDTSFSYYYGWRKEPTVYTSVDENNNQVIIQPKYNRVQGIGIDFAKPFGKYVFRGETAYFLTATEDLKDDYLQYVLGVDFNATDDLYINAQLFGDKEINKEPQNGVTLAVEYSINEFNKLELNNIYQFEDGEFVINPVYSNDLMDGINFSVGAYMIEGNKDGDLGQFADEDYIILEFSNFF